MKEIVEEDITGIRENFKKFGVIIAEVHKDLTYKWIENPHPDFQPHLVIGKRDDQLIPFEEAAPIMAFKNSVFETRKVQTVTLLFHRTNGPHLYNMIGYPVKNARGQVLSVITIGFNTEVPDSTAGTRIN